MSSDIVIRVTNLSKCYQIYDSPRDRLKQFVLPRFKRAIDPLKQLVTRHPSPVTDYYKEFWALKNVSFEVKRGETIGIIGRNGSGKSTLLQMICGTLSPTTGGIQTYGRIAALLELGSGFNPEFTGRENVYMNGAILGLSHDEIADRFEEIALFADIGEFIEQPVKTYSSGMFVRLAFAANIMSNPEIMIVDEALAVGDMNFQAKCMTALTRIQENGATVIFVSHDIKSVKSLCSRAVYLEHGQVVNIGAAAEVTECYVRTMRQEMNNEHQKVTRSLEVFANQSQSCSVPVGKSQSETFKTSAEFATRVGQFRYGTGDVKSTMVELLNLHDESITFVEFNQKVKIRVYFEAYAEKSISVNVSVMDDKKNNITGCGFQHVDQPYLKTRSEGKYLAEYIFQLPLQEGNYTIRVNISSPIIENESAEFIDVVNDAVVFQIGRCSKARVWSQVCQFAELRLKELQ